MVMVMLMMMMVVELMMVMAVGTKQYVLITSSILVINPALELGARVNLRGVKGRRWRNIKDSISFLQKHCGPNSYKKGLMPNWPEGSIKVFDTHPLEPPA